MSYKQPKDMTRKELEETVGYILHMMYGVWEDDIAYLDPENEWDADTIAHVAGVLDSYELVPQRRVRAPMQ